MNEEEVLQIIKKFSYWFSGVFASLDRWILGSNQSRRTVWLKCFGVPFHTWDTKVIKAIGQRFGSYIGVAKETMEKLELGSGRVCIHSEIQSFINKEIELEILGKLFLVSVREQLVWKQQHGFGMSMDLQFPEGSFS